VCIDESLTPKIHKELENGNINVYGLENIGVPDIPYGKKKITHRESFDVF
jgi:hypothetical protein